MQSSHSKDISSASHQLTEMGATLQISALGTHGMAETELWAVSPFWSPDV